MAYQMELTIIILGTIDKDCGGTGDVFFMFQVTDRSGLTDVIEDIHIEIIKP